MEIGVEVGAVVKFGVEADVIFELFFHRDGSQVGCGVGEADIASERRGVEIGQVAHLVALGPSAFVLRRAFGAVLGEQILGHENP